MKRLQKEWFAGNAVAIAPKLLGKIVKYGDCSGRIVETEAYTNDEAAHSFTKTPRSQLLYDTYGHWYVYFTYGMHFCANVTTNKDSAGAVLIRAVEPLEGIEKMEERRQNHRNSKHIFRPIPLTQLCSGPAKFAQAFGISTAQNGLPIAGDFAIYDAPELQKSAIGISPRIGISKAADLPWRFYIKGNAFVSRKA